MYCNQIYCWSVSGNILFALRLFKNTSQLTIIFFVYRTALKHVRNVLSGGCPTLHGVVGIGANIKLPLIEELAPGQAWLPGPRGHITEFCSAATPEAVAWANRLAAEE